MAGGQGTAARRGVAYYTVFSLALLLVLVVGIGSLVFSADASFSI